MSREDLKRLSENINKKTIVKGYAKSNDDKALKIKTERSGLAFVKTLITALLIGGQIALLIYTAIAFSIAFKWLMILNFTLSFIFCVYLLSTDKNSTSKAVWIMFLLLGFTFSPLIFILADERVCFFKARKKMKRVNSFIDTHPTADFLSVKVPKELKEEAKFLFNTGKFMPYENTEQKYFDSGNKFFEDLLAQIESAKKFIFIEFFIIGDGALLNRFIDLLIKRVKEGVSVRIIYDDMGSGRRLSKKTRKRMIEGGIKIKPFNRLVPIFSVGINYRDHRKIVVIDGKTAYTGGVNLADEYVNERRLYGYWKDSGLRLDGCAVDSFTLLFLKQWAFITGEREDFSNYLGLYDNFSDSGVAIPYADGFEYANPIGKTVYQNLIASAKEKIYIMSPYFIVDDAIKSLLISKATSGVDVRIVLPEVPDKTYVYLVSRNFAEKLTDYGVKVYIMKHSFVHSKIVMNESKVCIGSVNMDLRSFYQQAECAVLTNNKGVIDGVNLDFESTFNDSYLITPEKKLRNNRLTRAVVGILQIFSPFM